MTALVRYQLALLLRAQRWLPPLLLYVAALGVGVQAGRPVLDSLGFAAAVLLPVAAWLVRVCVTGEPEAARHCAAAALGPGRTHLAGVLAALTASAVLGAAGTGVVALVSDAHATDGSTPVPLGPAVGAGLLAALACALSGTAVGVLCNRPLVHGTGWAVSATVSAVTLALVAAGSPANAAVGGLVTASREGTVPAPWLPLALSAGAAALAAAVACALSSRRR
ncbi:ABC transporter [Streptomyces phytohabitans]|uniref:ABC transporter n=1 Tax=Streptomyces phytohabitans TaxID=1150371 RepID=UPI00345C40DE